MARPTAAERRFVSDFVLFERALNGSASSPIHVARKEAMKRFQSLQIPTTKNEEWKYTNLARIAEQEFERAPQRSRTVQRAELEKFFFDQSAYRLVFIDGIFATELSSREPSIAGARLMSMRELLLQGASPLTAMLGSSLAYDDAFTALNAAFLEHGSCIVIDDGVACDRPIHLLYVTTRTDAPFAMHPRNLIVVGKGSTAFIVEQYESLASAVTLTNAVTELFVGEAARVDHVKIQNEHRQANHFYSFNAQQHAGSVVASHNVSIGGALVRNNVNATLQGERCETHFYGLTLAGETQHADNHTLIDHAKPSCNSNEVYKGIFRDRARGVFNGKIIVRPDAQQTDAKQQNKNLLLSDDATIDTKPQLEIFANDVRCTHGATVGQLEDEQIFYLRSRGIDVPTAHAILTHAFASDILNRLPHDGLRQSLEATLTAILD